MGMYSNIEKQKLAQINLYQLCTLCKISVPLPSFYHTLIVKVPNSAVLHAA